MYGSKVDTKEYNCAMPKGVYIFSHNIKYFNLRSKYINTTAKRQILGGTGQSKVTWDTSWAGSKSILTQYKMHN